MYDIHFFMLECKACGPDRISPCLLKEGAYTLARLYAVIFNRSVSQWYFPSSWKEANVTHIFKGDDKYILSNYRPVSLLNIVGKAMERCIRK